jgi:hypothetical protein
VSNAQLNAATRVRWIRDGDTVRAIRCTEKAVLIALANDARDYDEGRARLTPHNLQDRASCSLRAVRYAFARLVESGHITREAAASGAAATTIVHPNLALFPTRPVQRKQAQPVQPLHGVPVQPLHGSFLSKVRTKETHPAGARANRENLREQVPPPMFAPDVVAVFDRWDGMAARAELAGPVQRTAARGRAIDLRLGEEGRWRVLAAVDAVGRSDFLRGKRAGRQGDFFRTNFDWIFLQKTEAGIARFTQLLEGNFTGGQPVLRGHERPAPAAAVIPDRPGEPPGVRARITALVGAGMARAWLDECRFALDGEALVITARSPFVAEQVSQRFGPALTAAAGPGWRIAIGARPREPVDSG